MTSFFLQVLLCSRNPKQSGWAAIGVSVCGGSEIDSGDWLFECVRVEKKTLRKTFHKDFISPMGSKNLVLD